MNYTDVVRIAAHLGMTVPAFIDQHASRFEFQVESATYEAFHLDFGPTGCRFLLPSNLCGIHSVKPWQCRHTPYRFFYEGEQDWWCMKDVPLPPGWTSARHDSTFVSGLRKVNDEVEAYDEAVREKVERGYLDQDQSGDSGKTQ